MGDMRRAALVIGCGDSDLRARITSNWLEGERGLEYVKDGDRSDVQASQSQPGDYVKAIIAPASYISSL